MNGVSRVCGLGLDVRLKFLGRRQKAEHWHSRKLGDVRQRSVQNTVGPEKYSYRVRVLAHVIVRDEAYRRYTVASQNKRCQQANNAKFTPEAGEYPGGGYW